MRPSDESRPVVPKGVLRGIADVEAGRTATVAELVAALEDSGGDVG